MQDLRFSERIVPGNTDTGFSEIEKTYCGLLELTAWKGNMIYGNSKI